MPKLAGPMSFCLETEVSGFLNSPTFPPVRTCVGWFERIEEGQSRSKTPGTRWYLYKIHWTVMVFFQTRMSVQWTMGDVSISVKTPLVLTSVPATMAFNFMKTSTTAKKVSSTTYFPHNIACFVNVCKENWIFVEENVSWLLWREFWMKWNRTCGRKQRQNPCLLFHSNNVKNWRKLKIKGEEICSSDQWKLNGSNFPAGRKKRGSILLVFFVHAKW